MSAKWVARGRRRSCRRRTGAHLGLMEKPAKNEIFKKSWNWRIILMPAIVWQIFEYETNPITGNGNCVNWRKLGWKNSWNHFKLTYFWKVLAIWTTVGRWTQSRRRPRAASFLAAGSCTRHAPACPPVFRGCSAAFKPPLLFAIACKANKVIYDLRQLFLGGAHPQLRQPEHHAQEVVVEIVEGLLKVRKSQNQIALFSYVLISSKKRKKILF